jgi:hypothetical protein
LRARRDAVEAAGGGWDPIEAEMRRAAFRRLAAAFPGALRELERPAAELRALADEVAAEATAGAIVRPWVHLCAAYHELLAEALAAKLWLARRLGPRGAVDDATLAAAPGALGRALDRAEAEALRHPPRGRVVELVWRELSARSGLSREVVRALVLGAPAHDTVQ